MSDSPRDYAVLIGPAMGSYIEELEGALEANGVDVRTIDGRFPILSGLREEGAPDVLHLHFLHHYFRGRPIVMVASGVRLILGIVVAKLAGATVLWTVHNLWGHETNSPRIEIVFRHVVARLCDTIVVHCEAAIDNVIETYRLPASMRRRIVVVPHGNYVSRYPDEVSKVVARRELELEDDEFVYLFFGYIRPYKNVGPLVRTFKQLDLPGSTLLVVGEPIDEALRRQLDRLCGDDDRIRTVFEFVPDEEIQLYMRAADVAVLPFQSILTSGSVMLAMSFARPVIAPRRGCVGEMLDPRGGFLYDPEDPEGLSTAMVRAYPEELEELGEWNYEKVAPLDWDTIGKRTMRLYASCH